LYFSVVGSIVISGCFF
jgi:hypothetical protein